MSLAAGGGAGGRSSEGVFRNRFKRGSKARFTPCLEEKCKKEQKGFDGGGELGSLLARQPKTLTRNERKEGVEAECFRSF